MRPLASATRVPPALIIGRARCGGRTWLLLESRVLMSITDTGRVESRPMRGSEPSDRPWGLACASGALWTMATPRQVARISPEGVLDLRVNVLLPRVALFGFGDSLLFQSMPVTPGTPALRFHAAGRPNDIRAWPGLSARSAATREQELSANLVNCGLPRETLPCWFANDLRVVMSDGSRATSADVSPLAPPDVDRATPIWDVAAADTGRLWLLLVRRGKGATRLVAADGGLLEVGRLDLPGPARTIVAASARRCLLVMADGTLVEGSRR